MYRGDILSRDMESLSSTAYVILGMVREQPRSGYEIKAMVDGTTRFFWAASYGQIYPELKRLAEAGLVVGADAPTGGRRRTVYEITADGEEELKAWLRRPPETYEMRDEGLLKLFFAAALEPTEAAGILGSMRAHRLAANAHLRQMKPLAEAKAAADGDSFPLLVLEGGLEFTGWFADWCGRVEQRILDRAKAERA
jgi:PadR family transcriptional regulator, regulatory protein AphA